MKSQKLSIYLIKENITEHSDIVKDLSNKEKFDNGTLYYKRSFSNPPTWTGNFFNRDIEELKNSSASGLYITKITHGTKEIYFGLSFGHGWQMFQDGVIVEQFGIKTTLSIIKDEIKHIEKKNFTNGLKDVSEQLGKIGSIVDFGFNTEQDIMRAVAGEPENQDLYGKNVVGKNALSLSTKKNVDDVIDLLVELYKAYISNKYTEKFDWFDKFSAVSDKKKVSELNAKLIKSINNADESGVIYWLSIPEVINWENTKCFKYNQRPNDEEYQDITFEDFKNSLRDSDSEITLELLKNKKVFQIDVNDTTIQYWTVYNCLYAEIDTDGNKYLLVSGKYYKVDTAYKEQVENEFSVDTSLVLPDWEISKHENVYNTEVATNDADYQCLDGGAGQRNLIGNGKIEFADLVKNDKYLIHVKKYGSSSVLSHLFSQGLVSSTLLLTDKSFRTEVNSKLSASHKNVVTEGDPNPAEYTVVYAIGTTKDTLKLPFFSLVNYRNAKKQLKLYGYNKVLLIKIKQL